LELKEIFAGYTRFFLHQLNVLRLAVAMNSSAQRLRKLWSLTLPRFKPNSFHSGGQMQFKIPILLFLPGILLLHCSLDPIVTQPERMGDYYVFCKIQTQNSSQTVLVGKSVPESLPQDIDDATVTMQVQGESFELSSIGKGYYRDLREKIPVLPGKMYNLNVTLPNGENVSGSARVPGAFQITHPAEGDTIPCVLTTTPDTLTMPRVSWTPSEFARYYSVSLVVPHNRISAATPHTFRNEVYFPELIASFNQDSVAVEPILLETKLWVTAYDSSRIEVPFHPRLFIDSSSDLTPEEEEMMNSESYQATIYTMTNLQGALGTFSANNRVEITIFLKIYIDWQFPGWIVENRD
jgi:hypothetical protein